MIVRSTDQNNYQQIVTIGRSLIYSSDYQKCLFLNKKLKRMITLRLKYTRMIAMTRQSFWKISDNFFNICLRMVKKV
jgi:DNA helicase TIP49 (TBP-interacting protein)